MHAGPDQQERDNQRPIRKRRETHHGKYWLFLSCPPVSTTTNRISTTTIIAKTLESLVITNPSKDGTKLNC